MKERNESDGFARSVKEQSYAVHFIHSSLRSISLHLKKEEKKEQEKTLKDVNS